jgi:AcrR family transcriptional regulator
MKQEQRRAQVRKRPADTLGKPPAPRRGRPRSFDPGQALDRALEVFRAKGYEGASLDDLTRAMGINRPSLYAAFGNKQSLFRRAVARYAEGPAGYVREALALPTARAVVERLLRGGACVATEPGHARGCLMVRGALTCGDAARPAHRELAARRAAAERALRRRLERAKNEGDLPPGSVPADLARYVVTVLHGISVQAAGGASRAALQRVADTALRAWPA